LIRDLRVLPGRLMLVTVVCAALVLGGRPYDPAHAAPALPRGGTLHTAFDADFSTLDPAVGYDPFAWTGEHSIFEGLLDYASASGAAGTTLVPRLAASLPVVSKDGLTYTFTLRQGVHFQAPVSREVVAEDVRYSVERALSPNTPNAAMNGSSFWSSLQGTAAFWSKKATHISGITVSGKYGISFRLSSPDRAFLNILAMPFASVVPSEWVAKWGKKFGDHALGTGPFVLQSWVHGSQMVLARNPSYYRPGVPLVDKVVIDFNVSDHLQVQRVQAGVLDVGGNLVTADDFLSIKNDAKWSKYLTAAPDIAVNYLGFNLTQAPFKGTLKLRQALNMALNKAFILRLLNNRGIAMNGILPPTMPGADTHFTYYAYDPTKAAALLKSAGYSSGQLTIPLTYQKSGDFDKVAQEIQSELGAIGITVQLKPVSADTWYGSLAYTQKEGPMVLAPWGQDYPDPSDFFDPILSCGSSSNAAFYCNHAVDALGAKARALANSAQRYALYRQMEKMVMADAPWAPLYDGVLYDFHSTRLQGFYIPPVWPFTYADYAVGS
jgi:ABC-type transport system substrate-binding protein